MATKSITALAPWFGAARMIAEQIGQELKGCRWVGVPFAGGMTELLYIDAPSIVVSDLHRHVINLANCVANSDMRAWLIRELNRVPFHHDVLERAQAYCTGNQPKGSHDGYAAFWFFITAWMGRSGKSGTAGEFKGALPVRWNANGGDSCTRFRSGVRAIGEWGRVFRRCNFLTLDALEFIDKVNDTPGAGVGIYVDPPFPDAGDDYRHKFSKDQHRTMAAKLTAFKHVRVVCRFYDHPLIRELYLEADGWTWNHLAGGRKQTNESAPEVLIVRN